MLTKFAVSNYRGFKDRIELDLSRPANYNFNTFAVKDGVVKDGIIYGRNGSGKSNLSLAVFDIANHLSHKWKKRDYYANFANIAAPDEPVRFEYSFRLGGRDVSYSYAKGRRGALLSERMEVDGSLMFERADGRLSLDGAQFPMPPAMEEKLGGNANGVSVVNFLLSSYPLPEGHPLMALSDFVDSMLWFRSLDDREFIGLEPVPTMIEDFIVSGGLLDDFRQFLEEVGGQRFELATPSSDCNVIYCRMGDGMAPFVEVASTGTKSLELLYFWIKHLDGTSLLFIDEFDAFYHFELSREMCRRLFALDCQVFLTSHNTFLMTNDLLRPDCNFVISDGGVRPVCDLTGKELRLGHNIEKLYRGGAFGR